MKLPILGPFGYISQQPDGTIQSRVVGKTYGDFTFQTPGAYEIFEIDIPTSATPAPPVSVVVSYDVPYGTNFNDPVQLTSFVTKGLTLAYGRADSGTVGYWVEHSAEMLARGTELGMTPPERYYWERIIGRGAGGSSIALYGPYAGLNEDQTSRTP